MASRNIAKRPDGMWRARYRDEAGKEHSKHFRRKKDGEPITEAGWQLQFWNVGSDGKGRPEAYPLFMRRQ
ncbi:MAG TPA: hypothetical protein VFY11_12580 [Nocardioidaceae bacterium]|nr:hypothetical protein [Nocardioidaceae bacterium]